MTRPTLGVSKTVRLDMVITADEITAIDDWRYSNRIPTRSEAIRQLIALALKAEAERETN